MKGKLIIPKLYRFARRLLFWLSTLLLTVSLVLLLVMQTEPVQNGLARIIVNKLNDQSGSEVSITNVRLNWLDYLIIKDFLVKDYMGDTLAYAEKVAFDYNTVRIIRTSEFRLDELIVDGGVLNLVKYADTLNINLVEYLNEFRRKEQETTSVRSIGVDFLKLTNCEFSYRNELKDSIRDGRFDYSHFNWEIQEARFDDLIALSDSISVGISRFSGVDNRSGFKIKSLQSNMTLFDKGLFFDHLKLTTPWSVVEDKIHLNFRELSNINYITDSVEFDVELSQSIVSTKDMAFFSVIPDRFRDLQVRFNGILKGSISNLIIDNFHLDFGAKSYMEGKATFIGLPNITETFMDLNFSNSLLTVAEVNEILGLEHGETSLLSGLSQFEVEAEFLGFVNDFVSTGLFKSQFGNINTYLNIKVVNGFGDLRYKGVLEFLDFDLGAITRDTVMLGNTNLVMELEGSGTSMDRLNLKSNSVFTDTEIFGHLYDTIFMKADVVKELLSIEASAISDSSSVTGDFETVLSGGFKELAGRMVLDGFSLAKLGIDSHVSVTGDFGLDIQGPDIDRLKGYFRGDDIRLHKKNQVLELDSILVSTGYTEIHSWEVDAPNIHLSLKGHYENSKLMEDLVHFGHELIGNFGFDYHQKGRSVHDFVDASVDIKIDYQDLSDYLSFFSEGLYISENGELTGSYDQRGDAILSFYTESDSINWKGIAFSGSEMDLNLSKDLDHAGVLANLLIKSDSVHWNQQRPMDHLQLEVVWLDGEMSLSFGAHQPATETSFDIVSQVVFTDAGFAIRLLPSKLVALGDSWYVNPYNTVVFEDGQIRFDRLEFYKNQEAIKLTGDYHLDGQSDLNLSFSSVDLGISKLLLPTPLSGAIDLDVSLLSSDTSLTSLTSRFAGEHLFIDKWEVGKIRGQVDFDILKSALVLDCSVEQSSLNTVRLAGQYHLNKQDPIDIRAKFDNAKIDLLNPFLSTLFSGIDGTAEGEISISGDITKPSIFGEASISEGQFTIDYLNTTYSTNGDFTFDNTEMTLNRLELIDRDGNRGIVTGKLTYEDISRPAVDISLAANKMMVLNTSRSENQLYYGTAFGTGDVRIQGTRGDLVVKAKAISEKGTKIFIPLSSTSDVELKEYITFVDLKDTVQRISATKDLAKSFRGVSLDLDIDVTEDAYVELIFDIRTGDIIRGKGNGNLNMLLDSDGAFDLFGAVTISEGAYNFTIPNLINKEFNIVPGSTITWFGDPYAGIVDLKANYRQMASFADFDAQQSESVSRRVPFLVELDLNGEMLGPSIDFAIKLDQSTANTSTQESLFLQNINQNEQELKRQVFSLLILRKLSPQNNFTVGGRPLESGVSSVSEFLSNQFSYFISQVDENLELDFDLDLASLDQDAFNTFQLRLSYTFLDGRLRVTGGGAFPQTNDTNTENRFLGDWSIRYLLTEDGQLRVRAFSQNEQFIGNDWQRETGVSFQYIKSFDDLKDLLSKSRNQGIKTRPKEMEKEKDANKTSS